MTTNEKQIKEIRAKIEEINNKLKTIRADHPSDDKMKEMEDMMFSMMDFLYMQISYLADDFYGYVSRHQKGHLPSAPSAEHMERAVKALGFEKNFEIVKPVIYANKNKGVLEVEIPKVI